MTALISCLARTVKRLPETTTKRKERINTMHEPTLFFTCGYFIAVSLLAIGLTLYDKHAAHKGSWRIKERTLLIVSMIGGSLAMLVAMRCARHKTRHGKFMVGIPIIIIMQIAVVVFVWYWLNDGAFLSLLIS